MLWGLQMAIGCFGWRWTGIPQEGAMAITVFNNMLVSSGTHMSWLWHVYAMAISFYKGTRTTWKQGSHRSSTFLQGLQVLISVTAIFQGRGRGSGFRNLTMASFWPTTPILSFIGFQYLLYFFSKIVTFCGQGKYFTSPLLPSRTNYYVLAKQLILFICSKLNQQTVFSA